MIKDTVVNGCNNAPHRSLYNALGLTAEELQKFLKESYSLIDMI